jgi:GTP-binding protein HflX
LLTDTVGFIRKLPHDLVAAFRATLEGVEEASLIVHVVDSSHPHASELVSTVDSVLASLHVGSTPRLIAWNKIDLLADRLLPAVPTQSNVDSIAISAKTGENLDALLAGIEKMLGATLVSLRVLIPYDRYDLVGLLYEQATVEKREDAAQGIRLLVSVPEVLAERLAEFTDRELDK